MNSGDLHAKALEQIQVDPDPRSWDEGLKDHVANCPSCQLTATASDELRSRVRSAGQDSIPESMLESILANVRQEAGSARSERPRRQTRSAAPRILVPAALVAGLAIGVMLDPWGGRNSESPMIVDGEVAATVDNYLFDVAHDRYLLERGNGVSEFEVSDAAEASRALSDGLGFALELGSSPPTWELRSARLWHTVSRLSGLASYESEGRRIDVFAVPRKGIAFDVEPTTRRGEDSYWTGSSWGFRSVVWLDGDLAWAAVGTIEEDVLLDWVGVYRGRRP